MSSNPQRVQAILHYTTAEDVTAIKERVLGGRPTDWSERTSAMDKESSKIRKCIKKEAYRYRLKEHPDQLWKVVDAVRKYIEERCPIYRKYLRVYSVQDL